MMATIALSALLIALFAADSGWAATPQTAPRCPPGSVEISPGTPIQEEIEKAGENATICLRQGIHRLQEVRPLAGQSFHGEKGAIMNGARLITEFEKEGRFWTVYIGKVSERRHGQCAKGHETCDLPLRLLVDGEPLQRAMDLDRLKPGWSFFDTESGKAFIAEDPAGQMVEYSLTPSAFQSTAANVVIRGIIVEKYANAAQRGAIDGKSASNWSVENCEVRLNSGAGVSVGPGGRIVGSDMHHNGQMGAIMVGTRLLLQDNVIWENNRLNFDFAWEAGGVKIGASQDVLVSRNFVYRNKGPGLWCDIDCRNVLFENNRVEYNADAGIFYEISYNGVIRNNIVAFNGQAAPPWFWGADIQVAASENVDVYENSITTRAGGSSIMLIDQSRAKPSGGKYRTSGNFIYNNVMAFSGGGHAGGVSDAAPADENFSIIEKGGNRFDNNSYRVEDGSGVSFVWGHENYDWRQFRLIGQETGGTLSSHQSGPVGSRVDRSRSTNMPAN